MNLKLAIGVAILVATSFHSGPGYALFEAEATFESFYTIQGLGWLGWTAVGLIAVGIGVAVFLLSAPAAPVLLPGVGAFATWLGGLGTGLTGGAALNHGLALLGGGAIAAGGLGKAGGAAVLAAVVSFSFGMDVALTGEAVYRIVVDRGEKEYDYNELLEQSKGLSTLPLPRSGSGPTAYKEAMSVLKNIDEKAPLSIGANRKILKKAVHELRWSSGAPAAARELLEEIDDELPLSDEMNQELITSAADRLLYDPESIEVLEDASLLSLLYFIISDYRRAKQYAVRSIGIAQSADQEGYVDRTNLPGFILAASTLYDREFDVAAVISQLKASILSDHKNKLIPSLFAIFLDRLELRMHFNDVNLDEGILLEVFDIMRSPTLEDFRLENYVLLLSRYLNRLEFERQKIVALVNTENSSIKGDPRTLMGVDDSLDSYTTLLHGAVEVKSRIAVLELEEEIDRERVAEMFTAFDRYVLGRDKLASLVGELEAFQTVTKAG